VVFVRRERRFHIHEADDPVAELLVVQHAAEGGVLEVAVAVDEAGHDDRLAELLDGGGRMGRPQLRGRADGSDQLVPDEHSAPTQRRRRHGKDPVGAVQRLAVVVR
jgi:hypothetical protein